MAAATEWAQSRAMRLLNFALTSDIGGVAEVIRSERPYFEALGYETAWFTAQISNGAAKNASLFLHQALYGEPVADEQIDDIRTALKGFYRDNYDTAKRALELCDVVILHDAMTAVFAHTAASMGKTVLWRNHVGSPKRTESPPLIHFLLNLLREADGLIFSSLSYVWDGLESDERVLVVPPGIDPVSVKNRSSRVHKGMDAPAQEPSGFFVKSIVPSSSDFSMVTSLCGGQRRYALHLSRWDGYKGQLGVLRSFASFAQQHDNIDLVILGPSIQAAHFPMNQQVYDTLCLEVEGLDVGIRDRVHIWQINGKVTRSEEDRIIGYLQSPRLCRAPEQPARKFRIDGDRSHVEGSSRHCVGR